MAGEPLEFEDGTTALNLEEDNVRAVLMGTGRDLQEGSSPVLQGGLPRCQWGRHGWSRPGCPGPTD